jgi:VWA domain-containing protein
MIFVVACVLSVAVSGAAMLLAQRKTHGQLLPVAAGGRPGTRRSRLVYLGAVGAVAAVAGFLAWSVDGGNSHPPALPGETVIAIDVSGSITAAGERTIAHTLLGFVDYPPDRRAAVVYFSSSAALGSPPSSPAADLAGLARMFSPLVARSQGPWASQFDGGTVISNAIALSRRILEYTHARNGRVILISDLQNNPKDQPKLHRELVLLLQDHATFELDPLPPTKNVPVSLAQLSEPYRAVFGDHIIASKPFLAASTDGKPVPHTATLRARYPLLGLLLALALGTSVLAVSFFPRLAWRLG